MKIKVQTEVANAQAAEAELSMCQTDRWILRENPSKCGMLILVPQLFATMMAESSSWKL